MRKNIVFLFAIILMSSCQIREEMTINKNGSGEYRIGYEMGSMLKAMEGIKKDSVKNTEGKKDAEEMIEYFIPVDDIYKKAKDSLHLTKEEKKAFKEMKGMMMHIELNEKTGLMKFEYIFPYKKINQLNHFFQNLNLINNVEKRYKGKSTDKTDNLIDKFGKYKISYSFKGKVFKRKTLSSNKKPKKNEPEKENEILDKISDYYQYRIVYHFPYPIKQIKSEGEAKMSADRKTLYINVPLVEMEKNPQLLDFEVILE